jgi:hypothetical protein
VVEEVPDCSTSLEDDAGELISGITLIDELDIVVEESPSGDVELLPEQPAKMSASRTSRW